MASSVAPVFSEQWTPCADAQSRAGAHIQRVFGRQASAFRPLSPQAGSDGPCLVKVSSPAGELEFIGVVGWLVGIPPLKSS